MGVLSRATIAAGQRNVENEKNIQDLTFSLVRYDRMRRDSNLLYKPRVRTVSSSSSNNCSSRRSSVICNTFDLEELEEVLVTFNEQMVNKEVAFGDLTAAQVVENEVEVVERLKTWQDQLANTRSPDPFVGLPVDEQSPVRSTKRALDFVKTFFAQRLDEAMLNGQTLTTGCSGRRGRAGKWSPGKAVLILRAGVEDL